MFLGGIVCNNGGKLIKDLRAGLGPNVLLMGPDGFTPFDAVASGSGGASDGMLISVAGLPNERLGATGQKFIKAFTKAQKRVPDPYGVYMAQATEIALDAIARSTGTRGSVASAIFTTTLKDSIFGRFSFDINGDPLLKAITFYKMGGNTAKTFRVIFPPASLTC